MLTHLLAPKGKSMSSGECMFSCLIGYMQILLLKLVFTIFGLS
jgi:hypothetical protein